VKFYCVGMVVLLALFAGVLPVFAADTATPGAADKVIVAPSKADKAMATHVLDLAHKAQGTVGQESANFILNGWPHDGVRVLTGETPSTAKGIVWARELVQSFIDVLEKVPTWPKPPAIVVPYTEKAPVIDGKLDDLAWKNALVLHGASALNTTKQVDNTTWRLMWDEHYLYLGVNCADKEVIAPKLEHNGPIYNYDCVEFFLLPDFNTRKYWEIEVSATGDLYEAMNTKSPDHWGGQNDLTAHVQGLKYATSVQGVANKPGDTTTTGYTVTMAVPFDQLPGAATGAKGAAGMQLHFMLAHMDKNSGSFTAYAFYPLMSWTHNIWGYATMTLKK